MSGASRPSGRGNIDEPVLPCQDLDVEVVSDILEETADIEVEAKATDNPEPDLEVVATCEVSPVSIPNSSAPGIVEDAAAHPSTPSYREPDYDVEVSVIVKDAAEPDLHVTGEVDRSPVSIPPGAAANGGPGNSEEANSTATPAPPEPDFDVDVTAVVTDAVEPDIELTFAITGDTNEPKGTERNA